jgi:putative tryptophan/tyrosine transport system substrate-binding protein
MSLLDAGKRELGLTQGRDYVFETRLAGSDASRFSELAAELLASHPSAVVVSTNLADGSDHWHRLNAPVAMIE